MKKIGIIGASGFTGLELIRKLLKRNDIEICVLNSRSLSGERVQDAFPEFTNAGDLAFTDYSLEQIENMHLDLVFLAMENGMAMEIVPQLSCKIIDLSADFRFDDLEKWEKVYGMKHTAPDIERVYGLPEFFAEKIKNARVVANPGCFATASLLAVYPLRELRGLERIVLDGKTGVSGAGRKNSLVNNYNFLSENIIPYKIINHRHESEIAQFLPNIPISFTPHIVPMIRGMLVTAHVFFDLQNIPKQEEIIKLFEEFYSDSCSVKILQNSLPEPRMVRENNVCFLGGFDIDENGRLVIISAIDNLGKGASLQAIQNMDLMLS
jgi:N-acetyl-gamma-glutamyl-phosphate reductase